MNKEIIFCTNCQKIIEENMPNCNQCGHINLRYNGIRKNKEYKINKSNKKAYIVITIMILLNIIIFTSLCIFNTKTNIPLKYNLLSYTIITLTYFYFICFQLIFIKANYEWYKIFIPVYNLFLYFELCTKNARIIYTIIIPYIFYLIGNIFHSSIFISISIAIILALQFILMYFLADKFKINRFIFMLFHPLLIPIIAFNKKYMYK